jgi:hypothetical protein
VPVQKAARPRKEWYSVSVETLRGVGLIALLLAVFGGLYVGYRIYDNQTLERQSAQTIAEVKGLIQYLQKQERASAFTNEFSAAFQSFQEAQTASAKRDFRTALEDARRSRNLLLSIRDQIVTPGTTGEAQFIQIQGDVDYRRGDGGDWEEARSRVTLRPGDFVRTSENGSAEIMVPDGTLYTVRPNTLFMVSTSRTGGGEAEEQSIQMEYGWVDLNTAQGTSNVKTPGAMARVQQDSEAFVAVDKGAGQGRFGAFTGGIELESNGGLKREVQPMQQVVQTGDLLSEPAPLPGRPDLSDPADNLDLDMERADKVVLAWEPVSNAARYALQVSRNHLFVDNVIDVSNRTKTRATLGVRGEGTFQWRVAAYGRDGVQGPWSKPRKFRIASSRGAGGVVDKTPPKLDLEDVKSYGTIFIVGGRAEPGSRVEINGEQVKTGADGSFTKTVQLEKEGWSFIEISARDGAGNETLRRHRVFVENP